MDVALGQIKSRLEARLLDATTGQSLCSKKFAPEIEDVPQRAIELSFALMGNDRQLVSCGHEGGACKAINVDDASVTAFSGASGPGRFCASFMDTEIDSSWITFGG